MKKVGLIIFGLFSLQQIFAQAGKEYSYVSAEFNNILNLTISSDPEVKFDFRSMEDFQKGITRYNAVTLEVDATNNWDLFAYASSDNWTQLQSYTLDGEPTLPAEILEVQSSNANRCSPIGGNFNSFKSIKGLNHSGVAGGTPDANETQFVAGMVGREPGQQYGPGAAKTNPETNRFNIHYRIVPGMLSNFPNSTEPMPGSGYAQKGAYSIEIVYALVEDL